MLGQSGQAARELHGMSVEGPGFLELDRLRKVFGPTVAVDDLTLSVRRGEMVAFLGPSGCGKTTSLRMIAGLASTSSGRIIVGGRDLTAVPPYRRDMGLVFQSYALFPHLDVTRNIAFGLEMRKISRDEIRTRVAEAIALVRLQGRENRRPAELSGGQQQRVALARALVIRPSILLFDEPLSNLDAKLRDEMRIEIREIQRRLGITSIFVTHDQVEALTMCDRVAVMNGGRLEQFGTPEDLYERPATAFVASFVGRNNRLVGRGLGDRVEVAGTSIQPARRVDGPVELMIRPQRIELQEVGSVGSEQSGFNRLDGRVVRSVFAGDLVQTDVQVGDAILTVEQPNRMGGHVMPVGHPVALLVRAADVMVFPARP